MAPFKKTVMSMMRGMVHEAFLTSSAMCATPSMPKKDPMAVMAPIMQAPPTDDQPPKLENSVKTSVVEFFGEITHRGTMVWPMSQFKRSSTGLLDWGGVSYRDEAGHEEPKDDGCRYWQQLREKDVDDSNG
jgi:hypothetical protein